MEYSPPPHPSHAAENVSYRLEIKDKLVIASNGAVFGTTLYVIIYNQPSIL